jgi:hypothetical protein
MKKIIFLLVIILAICGCKKDNSPENSSSLIGEWSWISTCGLSDTDCQTPASTLTSHKLIFTSDSLYYDYQNDTLKNSSIYHTYGIGSMDKITYGTGSLDGIIKYDYNSGNVDRFSLYRDTLTLVNVYGFITWVSRYTSIKP